MSTIAQDATSTSGAPAQTGYANSSRNAIQNGIFAAHDYVRPGEEYFYAELDITLREQLAPRGVLEYNLVVEIRHATWRLRRCGIAEEQLCQFELASSNETEDGSQILDPMLNDATAKRQASIDRGRAHAQRQLHKCTAELRKLQTERQFRNECLSVGTDVSRLGIADYCAVTKSVDQHNKCAKSRNEDMSDEELERNVAEIFERNDREIQEVMRAQAEREEADRKAAEEAKEAEAVQEEAAELDEAAPAGMEPVAQTQTQVKQTPRNASCPCKSGEKYKRCCGKEAPPVLKAAA